MTPGVGVGESAGVVGRIGPFRGVASRCAAFRRLMACSGRAVQRAAAWRNVVGAHSAGSAPSTSGSGASTRKGKERKGKERKGKEEEGKRKGKGKEIKENEKGKGKDKEEEKEKEFAWATHPVASLRMGTKRCAIETFAAGLPRN